MRTSLFAVSLTFLTALPSPAQTARIQNMAPEEMWKRVELCMFPIHPAFVSGNDFAGTVEIGLGISPKGEVANYRVLDGPPALVPSAVNAIRRWKFRPSDAPETAPWMRVRALAHFNTDRSTSVELSSALLPDGFGAPGTTREAAQTVPRPASAPDCMTPGTLIRRVDPDYPAAARQDMLGGTVTVKAVIAENGSLKNIVPVAGPGLLTAPAINALRQWRYTPYLQNGKPIDTQTQISVTFTPAFKHP